MHDDVNENEKRQTYYCGWVVFPLNARREWATRNRGTRARAARTQTERDGGGVFANRLHGTNDDTNDGVVFVFVFNIVVVCALTRTLLGNAPTTPRMSDGEETRFRAIGPRARRWRKCSR